MDQPATPFAGQLFQAATDAECAALTANNPMISNCGVDTLLRNPTLQAWGFTSPGPFLKTITRYNPTPLTSIQNTYGNVAVLFVLGHEGGHHFDLQFHQPAVPWQVPVYPSTDYPLQPNITPYIAISWNLELRADAWGGCALAKTGNSIVPAQALQYLTANMENADIPPFQFAQKAIQAGYDSCS